MNSERLLFVRNDELERTAIVIQKAITLVDKINSMLCSSEMLLFDAVLLFSTDVYWLQFHVKFFNSSCEFRMLIGLVICFVF